MTVVLRFSLHRFSKSAFLQRFFEASFATRTGLGGSFLNSISLRILPYNTHDRGTFTATIRTLTTSSTMARQETDDSCSRSIPDMEDFQSLHDQALKEGRTSYIDPSTGFTVFTELTHLKRGKCCGNKCRHCPYGFEKVGRKGIGSWRKRRANSKIDPNLDPPSPPTSIPGAPVAKLRSGDMETAQKMVRDILERAGMWKEETNEEDETDDDISLSSRTSGSKQTDPSENASGTIMTKDVNVAPSSASTTSTSATSSINSTTNAHDNEITSKNETSGDRDGRPRSNKNVPYTRTGDEGTSQLGTGERRSKTDDAFEAMGSVDELCTFVGVAHSQLTSGVSRDSHKDLPLRLLDVMSRLFDVGSHIAKPQKDGSAFIANGIGDGFDGHHVDQLEDWIHDMTEDLPELTSFILPTGAPASASLHVCRTVCRRAERRLVPLVRKGVCDPNALKYLNRLSDFFFVSARWANWKEGCEEIEYRMPYEVDSDPVDREEQRERVHRSLGTPNQNES